MRHEDLSNELDPNLISFLARKTRDSLGKTLKDVSFNVSAATASNIETQEQKVTDKKVYAYLENLGITREMVKIRVQETQNRINKIQFSLDLITNMFNSGILDQGIADLKKIQLDNFHPLYAYTLYLEGRYLRHQNQWEDSLNILLRAIEIHKKNNYSLNNNFLSHVYNSLSICAYYLDDLPLALKYAENGLAEFNQDTNTPDVYYTLKRNQLLYLERSGDTTQAFANVNKIWDERHKIEKIKVKLGFYKSRATLLHYTKQYHEAIACVEEGIRIARLNNELSLFLI